jgi:hypothetical protein
MTLEKELKQAKDPIFLTTKNKKPDAKYQQESCKKKITRETFYKWVNIQGE